jgi:mRNA interferase RelE/StbE
VGAYKLLIKSSAGKELASVGSKADRHRIVQRIHALADDPWPHGSEKLAGYDDRYRVRQGNFRVVYLVDEKRREVTIFKVGDRKDVYRQD